MTELERIAKLEKKLKVRKRKALAKEYEKLGRKFYKKTGAKNITTAENMLDHTPVFEKRETASPTLTTEQFQQLQNIANAMTYNDNFWKIEDLKDVSQWLSQFRTENEQS